MDSHTEKLPKLKLIESYKDERRILENYIKHKARSGRTMNILEAGCGRRWAFDLKGFQYTLTGVDFNEHALKIRKDLQNDLHEAIFGDLRTINLEECKYDVIYSSFVLEHIDGAERVLNNFLRWLKPGGILILKIPDRDSVYGFITRLIPHWGHIVYYKYIVRLADIDKPGYGPFPVFYNNVVSRKGIHEFSQKHGFIIKAEYGSNRYMNRLGIFSVLGKLIVRIIYISSFGRLAADHNNLAYVIEKGKLKL